MFTAIRSWKLWESDALAGVFLLICAVVFFHPFFFQGKIPFPGDTLVGMYHPWRDVVWDGFTAGVPYKNPLITDPVRQQYVWRQLAVEQMEQGEWPLWNPYSFSGTPLLANIQSAPFYPLNILFVLLPFPIAWGTLVSLQPFLASLFLFLYLRFFRVSRGAAVLGGLAFGYGGFSIAWLEWNTVMQTLLWLPLILLAKEHLLRRWTMSWTVLFLLAECHAILAGHLQVLFYLMIVSNLYLAVRILQHVHHLRWIAWMSAVIRLYVPFFFVGMIVVAVTAISWFPAVTFISLSAREIDQGAWDKAGWFLPWQHLLQFIAPDFFGNPATNNYWGVWNYGEFIAYVGIIPLFFALYAALVRRRRLIWFFSVGVLLCFAFALPNPLARVPFLWRIPFLSSSQPTRLLSIVMFGLSILAGFGMDWWLRQRRFLTTIGVLSLLSGGTAVGWWFALSPAADAWLKTAVVQAVAQRNMVFPTVLFVVMMLFLLSGSLVSYLPAYIRGRQTRIFSLVFVAITVLDLFRFGWKFTPFTSPAWAYPSTKLIEQVRQDTSSFRIMATDRRVLPSNVSGAYHLRDVSGYDPLYLLSYNQFTGAWTRERPDITPAAFNRIVTPDNPDSFLTDLLGVKYIFSFGKHPSEKLRLVASEGETHLYENPQAFPRAFFVLNVQRVADKKEEMEQMYALGQQLRSVAVTTEQIPAISPLRDPRDTITLVTDEPNRMILETQTMEDHLLVVTEPWYPTWQVTIDGDPYPIHQVDFLFRGVVVPKGKHRIEFTNHWG